MSLVGLLDGTNFAGTLYTLSKSVDVSSTGRSHVVFIKNWGGWELEGFKGVELDCPKCNNHTEHVVSAFPVGVVVGLPFFKKPWLSLKKYVLVCPICQNLTKQLTKEEAMARGPKL